MLTLYTLGLVMIAAFGLSAGILSLRPYRRS